MPEPVTLSIAKEFSETPIGRDEHDHVELNGDIFREQVLLPKLLKARSEGRRLIVDFDGLQSCGSSFLESAFGGLVRLNGIDKRDLLNRIEFRYTAPRYGRYERSVLRHINKAEPA